MGSIEVYSECRLQVRLVSGENKDFERCLIELRQHDFGEYSLRMIDLNNNKSVIVDCPLVRRDQYVFETSINQPDILNGINAIYRLLLNKNSRDIFHNVLRTCLEEFLIVKDDNIDPPSSNNNQEKSQGLLNELSTQESEPYYRNDEPFDCITCMDTIAKGDGILFYNCLHPFCKPCLLQMTQASIEPTIKCPHDNCDMFIEEREIRGVVNDLKADQKVVDRLLDTSVRFAATRSATKTFHCITPDCTNWWFIEPEQANEIIFCNGCKHWICLACSVIHEGQTCREYQDWKLKETNDGNLRSDTEHLEAMVKNKEAMYCPGCRVMIQKISGCDWIQCTQCKLEICWPTQGPRWGPKGRGDTSGGCRCRADNGKLCVPNCQNCH